MTRATGKIQRSIERPWNLFRLGADRESFSRSIAESIRTALNGSLSPEEKSAIDRIEALRAEMNKSTQVVTRIDYGAGDSSSSRTRQEMQQGLETTDTLGNISRAASKPASGARLLFALIRTVRPASCIELGTSVGVSAAYQAAALELNQRGKLVTLEGARPLAEIARDNFQQLGLKRIEVVVGNFQSTLPEVLEKERPVDYVFVDGHHDEHATINYFEQILPSLSRTALLVFDDISWSEGMKRAWGKISRDQRVGIAVDLGALGLCAIDPAIEGPRHFRIPFE